MVSVEDASTKVTGGATKVTDGATKVTGGATKLQMESQMKQIQRKDGGERKEKILPMKQSFLNLFV